MHKLRKSIGWAVGCLALWGMTGCVSEIQAADFARTEFARIIADTIGQIFTLAVTATT